MNTSELSFENTFLAILLHEAYGKLFESIFVGEKSIKLSSSLLSVLQPESMECDLSPLSDTLFKMSISISSSLFTI